jgi:hypothetical protein
MLKLAIFMRARRSALFGQTDMLVAIHTFRAIQKLATIPAVRVKLGNPCDTGGISNDVRHITHKPIVIAQYGRK